MNNLIEIQGTGIQIKEYEGKRVVTLKDIDAAHRRSAGAARKRFNDNRKHFIEGVDYFVRNPGEAAKEYSIIAPNGLKLITESGYLMLVKSFTDDLAWEVQRELISTYFRVGEKGQQNIKNNTNMFSGELSDLDHVVSILDATKSERVQQLVDLYKKHNRPIDFPIPEGVYVPQARTAPTTPAIEQRELRSASVLLRYYQLGMASVKFNVYMETKGYLTIKVINNRKYKVLTEKGLQYGQNKKTEPWDNVSWPIYYQDSFEELFHKVVQ